MKKICALTVLLSSFFLSGCGYLRQLSEEGGVWGKIQAQNEQSSEPPSSPTSASPTKASNRPATFSLNAQDSFFTLRWTYVRRNETMDAMGILENRVGPAMHSVELEFASFDESGRIVRSQRQIVKGALHSKAARPFQIVLPPSGEEYTYRVSVISYEFLRQKDTR
jgi:hypothetical protein